MITEAQLKQMLPKNPYVKHWHKALEVLFPEYDIITPRRMAAFVAQCAHESGGFMILKENLNYKAPSLRKLFSKYFPTDELAQQYASKPNKQEAIANRIYASRMGNGDESSGDGFRFCGRGLIQLTGRSNYQNFADSIEVDGKPLAINDVPEYLATFEGAAQSACWFWETNRLNRFADADDIKGLTKAINGGYIGLEDREHHYALAKTILHA